MKQKKYLISYLVIDLLLMILVLGNLSRVFERAGAPFNADKKNGDLVVEHISHPEACPSLSEKDKLLFWSAHKLKSIEEIEFFSDLSSIGEKVPVRIERNGAEMITEITLVPFYGSPRFIIVMTIVGFIIWCMAVFVAFNRFDGPAAYSLHWALIGLAVTLLLTQGRISVSDSYTVLSRAGMLVSYLLMAGLFLFFTTVYPYNKYGTIRSKLSLIFLPILAVVINTVFWFIEAVRSPAAVESYLHSYSVFRVMLAIYAGSIIISVLDSYKRVRSEEDRVRLRWLLWGFVVGPAPFLFLIIIPRIIFSTDLILEEFAIVFLLATPFSFAVSFIKYRLFDVQIMINRSIVYTVLSILIGLIYALLIVMGASLIGGEIVFTKYLAVLLATLVIALILNPLRLRLQRIVDETLFPARVNYARTITRITEAFQQVLNEHELAECVVRNSVDAMPVRSIAFYIKKDAFFSNIHSHGSIFYDHIYIPPLIKEQRISEQPVLASSLYSEIKPITGVSKWIESIGFNLCVPLVSESENLIGIIGVLPGNGNKRFTMEEIEILKTIGVQASVTLGRLLLQKKVILEQEGRRKMEELNRLKSYFVSSVSHELQTPLTSIRMFTETLQEGKIRSKKKRNDYLKIIDRESERLSRLIDNVLDFARVERGERKYNFTKVDLRDVTRNAAASMKYQFKESGVELLVKIPASILKIYADADAITEVIINLLSNALKYSERNTRVVLQVQKKRKTLVIDVSDKGAGIPKNELANIFAPFYRGKGGDRSKGMGLGLPLIKHIVEAHKGTIEVESEPGKGSRFSVRLPFTDKAERKSQ